MTTGFCFNQERAQLILLSTSTCSHLSLQVIIMHILYICALSGTEGAFGTGNGYYIMHGFRLNKRIVYRVYWQEALCFEEPTGL